MVPVNKKVARMGTVADRLKNERARLGLNQTDFAAIAGQSKKSQMRYEAGERSPDAAYLSLLASAGADVAYILTGVRTTSAAPGSPIQRVLEVSAKYGPLLDRIAAATDHLVVTPDAGPHLSSPEMNTDSYAAIPLHEALLAAGSGSQAGEAIVDQLAFRRDWLKKISVSASAARLARVTGESMVPTLFPGDVVMIDTSTTIPPIIRRTAQDRRRSPIYALADGTGARIKRIERPAEDQLLLLSDNPDYAPELRTGSDLADLKIIGKVVWWGHTSKE